MSRAKGRRQRAKVTCMLTAAAAVLAASVGLFTQGAPGQPGGAPAQNAPLVRTASISGQVIDGDTGQAIGSAVVQLQMRTLAVAATGGRAAGRGAQGLSAAEMAAQSGMDFVMADGDGRFVFHDLPSGPARLVATLGGYVERPGAAARPLQLVNGQHLSDVKLRLVKTASVSGVILDEAGEPLVGAQVRVLRRDMPAGVARYALTGNARTDDRGMYRLDGLVPGQFFIVLPQTQTTMPVANAEKSADAMNGLLGANNPIMEALTGGMQTMLGSAGVRVGDQMWQSGAGGALGGGAVPPPPVNGRVAAYQTTFYPGATQLSQATPVALRSGESRTGVDWQVRPTGVARVSGTVMGADGPAASLAVRLISAPGTPDDDALPVATTTTAADGSFVFMGVPTGQHVAKAQQMARGGMPGVPPELMASLPPETMAMLQGRLGGSGDSSFLRAQIGVTDRDVAGLSLSLKAGAKVSGRVVFDGVAAQPTTQQLTAAQVSLAAIGGGNGAPGQGSKLVSDGTFKTSSSAAGNYTVSLTGVPGAWMMRSVMVAGRETVTMGFELGDSDVADVVITFTDRIPSISGAVKAEGTAPLPNATVIMIPADYRAWLASGASGRGQVTAIVQPNGNYAFGRLLPGDYLLAAVPDEALVTDHDTAFYDALARVATRVTVTDGEKKALDLRFLRSIR